MALPSDSTSIIVAVLGAAGQLNRSAGKQIEQFRAAVIYNQKSI
jgi:hypothetical protein